MYRSTIRQSYNPECEIVELLDSTPKPNPIVVLNLDPDGVFDDPNAPFLLQVRTFTQNLVLKTGRELVVRHLVCYERFAPVPSLSRRSRRSLIHFGA